MSISDSVYGHASNNSEIGLIAAIQHISSVSGTVSPDSSRIAFIFPEASRNTVVVVITLVHESDANVYSFNDVGEPESQASMRGSNGSFELSWQHTASS